MFFFGFLKKLEGIVVNAEANIWLWSYFQIHETAHSWYSIGIFHTKLANDTLSIGFLIDVPIIRSFD